MSTAEQNADVVRRGYAAFNAADLNTLTDLMAENASWHTPGRSRIAGDHRGRAAVFAQFGRYGGETNGTFKADLQQVFGSENGRGRGGANLGRPHARTPSAWRAPIRADHASLTRTREAQWRHERDAD